MRWYLKNRVSHRRFFLNVGRNSVGRGFQKDLRIAVRGISKHHAIVKLKRNDKVYLNDSSKLGVYVNYERIIRGQSKQLRQGDIITFGVDIMSKAVGLRPMYEMLSYVLHRKRTRRVVPIVDLTSTDDDDDHPLFTVRQRLMIRIEKDKKIKKNKKIKSKNKKPKTKKNEIKKEKNPKPPQRNGGLHPDVDCPILMERCKIESSSTPPLPSAPPPPPQSNERPVTPAQTIVPLPTNEFAQCGSQILLKALLQSPNQSPDRIQSIRTDHEGDPFRRIIAKILKWNHVEVTNSNYNAEPRIFPRKTFHTYDNYKTLLTSLIECSLWYWIKHNIELKHSNIILSVLVSEPTQTGTLMKCQYVLVPPSKNAPSPDQVFLVDAITGGKTRTFFAYVTKVYNDNMLELQTSCTSMVGALNLSVKARCLVDRWANALRAIHFSEYRRPIDGIVHPASLAGLTPRGQQLNDCPYGKFRRCVHPLSDEQYEVFWDLYNNSLDAIISTSHKEFVTIVDGVPGSGKSRILIELVIALTLTEAANGKHVKILVTAGSDEEIDMLAKTLHEIRMNLDRETASKLNFIRYGGLSHLHPVVNQYLPNTQALSVSNQQKQYIDIVHSANIIFCHPRQMFKLQSRYVKDVDVVLMDNASQIIEYESVAPILFSPKVFILFGDQRMRAKDCMNLIERFRHQNWNQTMFQRFYNYKRESNSRILSLNVSYRFEPKINEFLNSNFYEKRIMYDRPLMNHDHNYPFVGFRLFNRRSDDEYMAGLLHKMFFFANPAQYKYAIILPPNIDQGFRFLPREQSKLLRVSTNLNFRFDAVDILIIWLNKSIANLPQYSPENLLFAMTRAKRSVIIGGDIPNNADWTPILNFAFTNGGIVNVGKNEAELELILKNRSYF